MLLITLVTYIKVNLFLLFIQFKISKLWGVYIQIGLSFQETQTNIVSPHRQVWSIDRNLRTHESTAVDILETRFSVKTHEISTRDDISYFKLVLKDMTVVFLNARTKLYNMFVLFSLR
jgi:hypothetical protein